MQLSSEHHSSTIQSLILFGQKVFHLKIDFYVSWLSSYQWIVSYHPFLRLICGRDQNAGCKFVYESFDLEQTGVPNSFCLLNWPLQENINTHIHTHTLNWPLQKNINTHTHTHRDTKTHSHTQAEIHNFKTVSPNFLFICPQLPTSTHTHTQFMFLVSFFISFFAGDKSNMIVLDVGLGPLISNLLCGEYT